jgi:hypothetical protein
MHQPVFTAQLLSLGEDEPGAVLDLVERAFGGNRMPENAEILAFQLPIEDGSDAALRVSLARASG